MKYLKIFPCFLTMMLLSQITLAQDEKGMHYGGDETFEYWAGEKPWEGIVVKNGQYWSSEHSTKEYILYMEVLVPQEMAQDFINDDYNKLELITSKVNLPNDAPIWFVPPVDFKVYKAGDQSSLYFIETNTGHMFMYEVQL